MRVLITQQQIGQGVATIAEQVGQMAGVRPLTVLGVMTGSVVLLADLIRLLPMPLRVGVVQASSYRGTERGAISINNDMMPDIAGRDVLLVDDIFDTGHTLAALVARLRELGAASVRTVVLLRKQGRQLVSLLPDFVAFEIPDEFVVGYGLDYLDAYRNLPFIAVLEAEDIAAAKRMTGGYVP